MIEYILFILKNKLSKFGFNQKKELNNNLKNSFGKTKDTSFDFNLIGKYFRRKDNSDAYQVLSDKTCADLDFDDLYMFLDRTNSKIGQQYLYNKLRVITNDDKQTKLDETIINELSKDSELRFSIQKKLNSLKSRDSYFVTSLFQEELQKPPNWFFAIKLLSFASLLTLILAFFNPIFFIVLIVLFCVNYVVHYWNKKNLFQYVNSIPQLLNLNNVAAHLFSVPLLKELKPNLSKSISLIDKIKNRSYFFQLETKLKGDAAIVFWLIFEIFKTLFLLEPLLLFGILRRLDSKRNETENIFKFVGHVDMLISIASVRNGLETFCLPNISSNSHEIIANEISHPLIYNCQTNAINIQNKSILLTGSNMSGKTSFIRAIGLNIITGLTINTCFAKTFDFPLLRIFSAIRISDDLLNDKSYYFEEVLSVKKMISESSSNKKNLFLLDELFKGTNTVERIAAGKAVLSALARNNNIVLVSTHDLELTDMLSNEYELYHFSETVDNNTVGFDYKLKEGKLKNRNAIRILKINDYPNDVVNEAMKISKELDQHYLTTKTQL